MPPEANFLGGSASEVGAILASWPFGPVDMNPFSLIKLSPVDSIIAIINTV